MTNENQNVDHPKHYNFSGIECIEAIESSMNFDAYCGFLKGNVFKYLWRYGRKNNNPVEDLEKARWYLNVLIDELKYRLPDDECD